MKFSLRSPRFVAALDTANLTSSMIAVNCFVPDSLIAATTPLIRTAGNALWTNSNFVAGDLTVNGLVGDASGKALETGLLPTSIFPSVDSCGVSAYVSVNGAVVGWEMGTFGSSQTTNWFGLATNYSAGVQFIDFTPGSSAAATGLAGFYSCNRTGHTDSRIFFANGSTSFAQIGVTSVTPAVQVPDTNTIPVFCVRAQSGAKFQFTSHRLSLIAFHQGLTPVQSQALYNAAQALRVALGGGYA